MNRGSRRESLESVEVDASPWVSEVAFRLASEVTRVWWCVGDDVGGGALVLSFGELVGASVG